MLTTQGDPGPAEAIAHVGPVSNPLKADPTPPLSAERLVPPKNAADAGPDIQRILGLSVPVSVTLAQRELSIATILDIKVGTIIEFDVPFDAQLTLKVASQTVGTGHAVKVRENFGLRVAAIGDVHERIEAMGGGGV